MVDPTSSSSPLTKFFEAGLDKHFESPNSLEQKVYLVASIIFGIITGGTVHTAYYYISRASQNDPDKNNFEQPLPMKRRLALQGLQQIHNPLKNLILKLKNLLKL